MGVSQMGHVSFLSSLRERGSPAERSRRGPTAHVTDVCRCMQDMPPPGHAYPTGVICECCIICLLLNMCLCIYMCLHVPSREGHPHDSIVACHAPCLRRLAPLVNAGQVEMVSAVGPYLRVICAPPPPASSQIQVPRLQVTWAPLALLRPQAACTRQRNCSLLARCGSRMNPCNASITSAGEAAGPCCRKQSGMPSARPAHSTELSRLQCSIAPAGGL